MATPTIHVHTQVDKSTVQYAKFMWETMNTLANHPEALTITVHCMGPTAEARTLPWIQRGKTSIVPGKKSDPLHGSYGHGACVRDALSMTGDGCIHVIADSDTVVIVKGWDDYLRKRMLIDGVGIIGTTYEDLGGFSSGANSVQTYKKIPTLTWCALTPMHDWRTLDIMPNKAHQVSINSPLLSKMYNLPEGYVVFGEVGWQLPQYIHDNSIQYEGWRQLKPSKDAVVIKGLSDYHEEYHAQGTPYLVHHRGSLRHVYRGDRISNMFYGTVDKHLQSALLMDPAWVWGDSDSNNVALPQVHQTPTSQHVDDPDPTTFVATGKEWLKITSSGKVIRPKKNIDRKGMQTAIELAQPEPHQVGHLRIEGSLEYDFPVVLPSINRSEPYVVSVRNLTGAALLLSCAHGNTLRLPPEKAWWVIVDVDGVQRVE